MWSTGLCLSSRRADVQTGQRWAGSILGGESIEMESSTWLYFPMVIGKGQCPCLHINVLVNQMGILLQGRLWVGRSGVRAEILLSLKSPAATAKSLQSCPTLCDLIDGSPPGSTVPGILQARTLEWVAISTIKLLLIIMTVNHYIELLTCLPISSFSFNLTDNYPILNIFFWI